MAMTSAGNDRQPMGEMNTTPLIDVMLVLLVMFIITIPVATNSIEIDVGEGEPTSIAPDPIRNRVTITARDAVQWNGQAVSTAELASLLQATRAMPVEPELQFEPQAQASYDVAARTTRIITASGVTNFGFVGNERYSEFGKAGAAR